MFCSICRVITEWKINVQISLWVLPFPTKGCDAVIWHDY